MSINQLVISALRSLNVPVAFQNYTGTSDPYVTFFCYLETGEFYTDDAQKSTGYFIQIDIWSKGNYSNIVEQVKTAMEQAGFSFLSAYDLYEKDIKIYHKAMRFYYFVEEE